MKFELADAINWYVAFLFSICCHEAAHAWAASLLGDDTARRAGQVTLDPTPHIKRAPFGTVVLPLLSFLFSGSIIGWAHAPYDPAWAQKYPRRCMLMSMAGPLANLAIALLALLLIRVGCEWDLLRVTASAPLSQMVSAAGNSAGICSFAAKILSITYKLNVLLCVFNLIPFPPKYDRTCGTYMTFQSPTWTSSRTDSRQANSIRTDDRQIAKRCGGGSGCRSTKSLSCSPRTNSSARGTKLSCRRSKF